MTNQEPAAGANANQSSFQAVLDNLDDPQALQAVQERPLTTLTTADILFYEGDAANALYVVVSGVLGVRVRQPDGDDLLIDRLTAGAIVGELALISNQPRSATVYAIEDASLLQISRSEFNTLTAVERKQLFTLGGDVTKRWQRLQLAAILDELFGDLTLDELHQLQAELPWLHFANGDILFRQGDEADAMYIVVNGRLRLQLTTPDGQKRIVGEIGSGETVGEFALIAPDTRSATVFAVRETNVVKITRPVFERITRERPDWLRSITRIIVDRRRRNLHANQQPTLKQRNISLLPTGPNIDLDQFATELEDALAAFGSVLTLNSDTVDAHYNQPGAAQTAPDDSANIALTTWLGEMESKHDYLLFVADASPSRWSQRCLNQSDHVLLIADPQDDPAPGPVEALLEQLQIPIRTDLVLWHPPQTQRPSNTLPWLTPRTIRAHHHLRRDDAGHMARLARRLSGRAIGLVCSGGAALGFVQQGVYKAMLELGIPVDYVAGTSMGAIMGGAIAASYSYAEIEGYSKLTGEVGVLDYTLPLAALTRSENVEKILTEPFGNLQIEDLWIPYFCVSANLTTTEAQVHERGSMWRAIRASMSIPGVFLPVVEDGEVLVDGGIMDNFPVARMAARLESPHIIGVLISPFKEKRRQYDYDTHISGWRVLLNRLNPFAKKLRLPSTAKTLIWAMEVNGRRLSRDQEDLAELIISPNVRPFSTTDYDKWRELAQVGYDAAIEPLRQWWAETSPQT